MRKKLLSLLSCCIMLTHCSSEDLWKGNHIKLNAGDYFVFASYFHECVVDGGCIHMYVLKDGALYQNTHNRYPVNREFTDADLRRLADDKVHSAETLFSAIPPQLLNESDTHIGCPDCYDQGGAYLEIFKNGNSRYWYIDYDKNNVPEYLHPLVEKIENTIAGIS